METVFRNLPTNKSPDFTGEFYQKFREELMPILFKLFHKIAKEGKLPNYETTITLNTKTRQRCNTQKRKWTNHNRKHRSRKDHKRLLSATICPKNGQLGRNG